MEFQLLDEIHEKFYDAYDVSQTLKRPSSPVTKRGKRRPSIMDEDAPVYDVKVKHLVFAYVNDFADRETYRFHPLSRLVQVIIPEIRQMTFAGLRIVFSSVIPLDVPPETTDIWRTAVAFGAECYKELNPRITHVVANKAGFLKFSGSTEVLMIFSSRSV